VITFWWPRVWASWTATTARPRVPRRPLRDGGPGFGRLLDDQSRRGAALIIVATLGRVSGAPRAPGPWQRSRRVNPLGGLGAGHAPRSALDVLEPGDVVVVPAASRASIPGPSDVPDSWRPSPGSAAGLLLVDRQRGRGVIDDAAAAAAQPACPRSTWMASAQPKAATGRIRWTGAASSSGGQPSSTRSQAGDGRPQAGRTGRRHRGFVGRAVALETAERLPRITPSMCRGSGGRGGVPPRPQATSRRRRSRGGVAGGLAGAAGRPPAERPRDDRDRADRAPAVAGADARGGGAPRAR
jgi:hypothetical protein